jgi:fructose PTS system EIIBC or EIIC component
MTRVSYMIPFAAADPLRVIPALMVGSAVTGALVMGFGNTSRAPHGGIWVVGLIGKPVLYVLAIVIGTVVTAAGVVVLKSTSRKEAEEVEPAASRQATATS